MTTNSDLLLESARRGDIHHAVILYGSSAENLRTIAVQIAMTVNCENKSLGDSCAACEKTKKGFHPDVHMVEVADDRKLIAIEQVRAAIAEATLRPFEGRMKVFIVQPAEAISISGANALLKTLEEPSRDTLFLLLARSPDLLLQTIRSRSQAVHLDPPASPQPRGKRPRSRSDYGRSELQLPQKEVEAFSRLLFDLLHEWADRGDSSALLAIASAVAAQDPVKEGIAAYAMLLRDLAALSPEEMQDSGKARLIRETVDRGSLLKAATTALRSIDRLIVNADPRLMVEQSLLTLQKI